MAKPRKAGLKPLLPKLHIFCEGNKTEPLYIRNYIMTLGLSSDVFRRVSIEKTKKNTPKELVLEAKKMMAAAPKGDIFWVVYDREAKQKYADSLHQVAYQMANDNNINVAITNVCFEFWLLIHFGSTTAQYSCCDDVKQSLKAKLAVYEKNCVNLIEKISESGGSVDAARINAPKINSSVLASSGSEDKPYQLNPYSDFYKLLDDIDTFSGKGN